MGKRSFTMAAVGLAFAGLGCYGQTDPATDVHPNGATLQARGTADNGPASGYFEYWKTSTPDQKTRTPILRFPAGASGPISLPQEFLVQNTSYSFRVCGWDGQEPEPPPSAKCAQTRSFSTPRGDAVDAQIAYSSRLNAGLQIHAWSRPDGTGSASKFFHDGRFDVDSFDGRVTCLAVQADRAAIGAVGTYVDLDGGKGPATDLVTLLRTTSGGWTVGRVIISGTTPPNCATASFANQFSPFVPSVLIQDG